MKRAVSKKTRFDVFKRDRFECQYCGAHPPGVLLHADHIHPIAFGGSNDIDNLITACESCNQGKGARLLSSIPQSLEEKAKLIAEREEQIRGYAEVMDARQERFEADCWRVMEIRYRTGDVPKAEFQSVKFFVEKLGVHETMEAMEIAVSSRVSLHKAFRYFCGICWNKIRRAEEQAA